LITRGVDLVSRQGLSMDAAAQRIVQEETSAGRRLPGLGHRAHTTDPRTAVLFGLMQDAKLAGAGIEFVRALEKVVAHAIKPLPINVDGAIGAVLYDLGFPPAMGKLIFIIGRVSGLSAQLLEEYTRERPMRIKIPFVYDGPKPRS